MSSFLGRRALVVGSGIGGLSAAGALADYFEQVDVLDVTGYRHPPSRGPVPPKIGIRTFFWPVA